MPHNVNDNWLDLSDLREYTAKLPVVAEGFEPVTYDDMQEVGELITLACSDDPKDDKLFQRAMSHFLRGVVSELLTAEAA